MSSKFQRWALKLRPFETNVSENQERSPPGLILYKSRMATPLLPKSAPHALCADDELRGLLSCLRWLCVDHSGPCRALASWILFFALAVAVPTFSFFVLSYSPLRRPFNIVVQLSLSAAAAAAFICLSSFLRRYRFLFLDKLGGESERVRDGYAAQLARSFRLLLCFVAPCFVAEAAYKAWWYSAGAGRMPFVGSRVVSDAVAYALDLASWGYRTGTFFAACVVFRLLCWLELGRLQEFAASFEAEREVEAVLRQHLRIRRQLRVISHRFRAFMVCCLVLVTASQLAALLLTTRSHAQVNLFNTAELALSSLGLVSGLLICLHSAAKITHKAQAITSHAAKWHACATIDFFEPDAETPTANNSRIHPVSEDSEEEEEEDIGDEYDELDNTKLVQPHVNTLSFQKRQALVTYLENNRAGITVFGFVLDRAYLHTIFMLELTLVLWLLGKTIGIS